MTVKERWRKWLTQIGIRRRAAFLQKQRRLLKNKTPSIICNNCIGGIVCQDLGLEYRSPTVGLYIPPDDFLRFANRLEEYLRCELRQIHPEGYNFPVGLLQLPEESVRVYFMHYRSFEEAKAKWDRRCKRVDPNNVYIIFLRGSYTHPFSITYRNFLRVPTEKKVMLTLSLGLFGKYIVPYFSGRINIPPGRILEYPHLYSKKRYIDRCNFVKFLNRGYTPPAEPQE